MNRRSSCRSSRVFPSSDCSEKLHGFNRLWARYGSPGAAQRNRLVSGHLMALMELGPSPRAPDAVLRAARVAGGLLARFHCHRADERIDHILYLTGSFYMLEIYDRVLPSRRLPYGRWVKRCSNSTGRRARRKSLSSPKGCGGRKMLRSGEGAIAPSATSNQGEVA